jgi:hypothetical protein
VKNDYGTEKSLGPELAGRAIEKSRIVIFSLKYLFL